jgi:hypothetical protein
LCGIDRCEKNTEKYEALHSVFRLDFQIDWNVLKHGVEAAGEQLEGENAFKKLSHFKLIKACLN